MTLFMLLQSTDILNDGQFNLPFDMVRTSIEDNLRDKMQLLRNKISSLKSKTNEEENVNSLRDKLSM